MLKINLLAKKVSKKATSAKNELYALLGVGAAVLATLYFIYASADGDIAELQSRITTVQNEIATLKKDVVRVEEFKKKTVTLEQKIQVIEKLKKQKLGPARMLDDLATILTDEKKVWLTKMTEKNGLLMLEGEAMEHVNISDFQIALQRRSKFFRDVKLDIVETKKRDGIAVLSWKLRCRADYSAG